MQYGTKTNGSTVAVTSGSPTVVGTGTTFLTSVTAGSLFTINNSNVPYIIGSITDDTHLVLTGNYAGSTLSGLSYNITTSYTVYNGLPYMEQGDIDTQTIFKRAMVLIDNLLHAHSIMSTLGDIIYGGASGVFTRLAGNITTGFKVLSSQGNGTVASAPAWVDMPTAGQSTFFMYNTASDIGGVYKVQQNQPSVGGLQTISTTGMTPGTDVLLGTFATPAGAPGITFIPEGIVTVHCDADQVSGTRTVSLFANVYKRVLAGTETLLCTTEVSLPITGTQASYEVQGLLTAGTQLLTTDRIVTKVYGRVSAGSGPSVDVNLFVENATLSRTEIPATAATATTFVPYSGATADVDLGGFSIKSSGVTSKLLTNTAATLTVATTDHTVVQTTAASVYTLPAAATYPGKEFHFVTQFAGTVTSASLNIVPLAGGAAGTAILAATAGKYAKLQSDGTNWVIIEAN